MLPTRAGAGSYLFTTLDANANRIVHPSGYTGIGGVLDVEVCIDAGAADAAMMEIPVQNAVKQINAMTAASPNLVLGAGNNIPAGGVDFESLTLHELGHCTGLGHPNLGLVTGVTGADTDFTKTSVGPNGTYAFNAGVDMVIGSSDDQRDDDVNRHWFEKLVNNPFLEVTSPQASTYSRDLADLPAGHGFPANAGRDVGALLGVTDTEAVMQQGQFSDEDQRRLQADDVATYRMAMTGVDEIAGTADDYTINLVYGGIKADTSGCDIKIESQTTGFGVCLVNGLTLTGNHIRITSATFRYNSNLTWFFNQVPACSAGNDTLAFPAIVHNTTLSHEACVRIIYGPTYEIGAGGDVTATAPEILLDNDTTITGNLTVINAVP